MRIIKLKSSRFWYIEYREAGEKKRVSTRCTDQGEAEALLAEFKLAYATERPVEWPSIIFVLDHYYEEHISKRASHVQAKIAIERFKRFYGSTPVNEIGQAKQQLYCKRRAEEGVADETIRREQSVLSAALMFAFKGEKLPDRPPPVYMPPESDGRDRVLSREEAAQLLRHLRQNRRQRHLLLFARLALATGARSGAILGLTWDRVDFKRGRINYIKPGVRRTNKRSVIFPMTPPLRRMLLHAQKHARGTHVISWGGEPVQRVIKAFRANAAEAGFEDVTPHTLRHTFGTWAAMGGANLHALAGTMGHSRTRTTERYAHHQLDSAREVARAARRRPR